MEASWGKKTSIGRPRPRRRAAGATRVVARRGRPDGLRRRGPPQLAPRWRRRARRRPQRRRARAPGRSTGLGGRVGSRPRRPGTGSSAPRRRAVGRLQERADLACTRSRRLLGKPTRKRSTTFEQASTARSVVVVVWSGAFAAQVGGVSSIVFARFARVLRMSSIPALAMDCDKVLLCGSVCLNAWLRIAETWCWFRSCVRPRFMRISVLLAEWVEGLTKPPRRLCMLSSAFTRR